jgi:hypothetical protein
MNAAFEPCESHLNVEGELQKMERNQVGLLGTPQSVSTERVFSVESHRCRRCRVELRSTFRLCSVSRVDIAEHTRSGADRRGCFTQPPSSKSSDENDCPECKAFSQSRPAQLGPGSGRAYQASPRPLNETRHPQTL